MRGSGDGLRYIEATLPFSHPFHRRPYKFTQERRLNHPPVWANTSSPPGSFKPSECCKPVTVLALGRNEPSCIKSKK